VQIGKLGHNLTTDIVMTDIVMNMIIMLLLI